MVVNAISSGALPRLKRAGARDDEPGVGGAGILAAAGNGVFMAATLAVSVRLLLRWLRTRQLPELAVGIGFLLVGCGLPLMAAGGIGRASCGDLDLLPIALGLAAIGGGIGALNLFTWRVFQPHRSWARALALGSFAAGGGVALGAVRALALAPADADPIAFATHWWLGLRLLFELWYAWTAVESLREWAMARRRLALGLSDPVVTNRFLLWGTMGAALALNGLVATLLEQRGLSPVHDAAPAVVLALNGLVAGSLMLLTFMPPRSYVDLVRRRAAQAT